MGVIMAVDPGTTTGVAITNVTATGTKFATLNKGLGLIRDANRGTPGRRGAGKLFADFGEVAVSTDYLPGSFVAWFQIGQARTLDQEYWTAVLLCDLIEMCGVNIVVFEDFILRVGRGSSDKEGLSPVRVTANAMSLFRERRIVPFLGVRGGVACKETQRQQATRKDGNATRMGSRTGCQVVFQPSSAMAVMTDERIRRNKLWVPGRPHAVDAIRHLCLLWRKCEVRGGHVLLAGSSHVSGDQPESDLSI